MANSHEYTTNVIVIACVCVKNQKKISLDPYYLQLYKALTASKIQEDFFFIGHIKTKSCCRKDS